MGISDKLQVEGGLESEAHKTWVIAGVPLRAPLRPINTKSSNISSSSSEKKRKNQQYLMISELLQIEEQDQEEEEEEEEDQECSTTPTAEGARIPETLPCPAAPRKPRPSPAKCRLVAGARDFFVVPPDLDSVFIRRVERGPSDTY